MDYYSQYFGALLCAAALSISAISVFRLHSSSPSKSSSKYMATDQAGCAEIIAGRTFKNKRNTLSPLEARARANTRLSHAFGIDNAFTTEDPGWHREYRAKALAHLHPDWDIVARDAKRLAETYQHFQNLVCLVQSFVLKMIIGLLYQKDSIALDDDTVIFVAREINRIWIQSKEPHRIVSWSKQHELQEALRQLIPDDPRADAMNLILPAFETMWRVVLRCLIEIRFRGAKETGEWTTALGNYLGDPNTLGVTGSIVREALRLYPPTRHVYRRYEFDDGFSTLAVADIEGLHRDTEIWGLDADCFRPMRWENESLNSQQSSAWMPFGGSPFVCPAKPEFGPKMIGILVASLTEAFSDVKFELRREGLRGQMDKAEFHGPLRSEKNAYEDLYLEVNAPCGC